MKAIMSLSALGLVVSLGVSACVNCPVPAKQRMRTNLGRWIDGDSLRFEDEASASNAELAHDARRLAGKVASQNSPEVIIDQALLTLLDSKPKDAAVTLRKGLERNPFSSALLNNLAVVELAMADRNDSSSLVLSLDALEKCLHVQPIRREPLFNRALVLERLSLKEPAREAWRYYIKREANESWKDIARKHLANNQTPSSEEKWREARVLLQQASSHGDERIVTELVSKFRQPSRIFVQEEVLFRWASSRLSGDRLAATKQLVIARRISHALAQINGEYSAADAVKEIESAEKKGLGGDVARGYLSFFRGLQSYQRLQPQAARILLGKAQETFRATGCLSLLLWTDLWLAGSKYYLGERQVAEQDIDKLLSYPVIERYPSLRGRAFWSRGLILLVGSRFSESLQAYRLALADFFRLGEVENTGAIQALMAENLHVMGEDGQAWQMRVLALENLNLFPSSVRFHNLLSEAADQLVSAGLPTVAQYFHTEDFLVSRRIGNPATVAEALLGRSRDFFALGRTKDAWVDMREARVYIAKVSDMSTREKLESEANLAAGELVDSSTVQEVLGDLTSAVTYYEEAEISSLAALAHLMRARTLLLLNQEVEARQDFQAAIELHESAVASLEGLEARSVYRKQWQPVFDRIIELEALQRKNPQSALDFLEYARSGKLKANVSTAVARQLRAGDVLVEYMVLSNRLLIWMVTNGSFRFSVEQIDEGRMEDLTNNFVRGLRESKSNLRLQKESRLLFRILVQPVTSRVAGATRWILVTDRIIGKIPFAALMDPVSGRYLIEDLTLIDEPSVVRIVARYSSRKSKEARGEVGPLLVVGNPTPDSNLYPGAEALPGAESESREVAALYKQRTVLVGKNASRKNFLRFIKGAKVVHFAGHAFFAGDDSYSSKIIFAPSNTGVESYISARELAQMDLRTVRLFVLSACDIAPEGIGGRYGSFGIADALLGAGVGGVIGTRWRIPDGGSQGFLVAMHRKLLEGKTGAQALRANQIEAIRRGRPPSLWAAFDVFGTV